MRLAAAGIAAAVLAAGIGVQVLPGPAEKPALGLFTSLPIYWPESDSIGEAIDGGGEPHWARTALETGNRLVPLDTLEAAELGPLDRLVMAQPRPLAPAENVALDDWVRGGGKLLLLADPLLTEHSRFLLGDKRRPQDMVVLSPILRRWGLELRFDEDQPQGKRQIGLDGAAIPVELAGFFALAERDAEGRCTLAEGGVLARCAVGQGRVLLLADAAVLAADRKADDALSALAEAAFLD